MHGTQVKPVSGWRIAAWSVAGLMLLFPLVAMQFTESVNWTVSDFVFAGALISAVGGAFELAVRKRGDGAYRLAAGVGLAAVFLLIWVNGAVGLIGSEYNDANLLYGGVLAIGIVGTILARFQARGMSLALFAMAIAQALIAVAAIAVGWGSPESGPGDVLGVNAFFVILFVGSAALFQKAAQDDSE